MALDIFSTVGEMGAQTRSNKHIFKFNCNNIAQASSALEEN